jgi:hypothetical protein
MAHDGEMGAERQRSGIRRILVLGFIDVAASALIAVLVFRMFGAYSGVDTNPPVCHNVSGDVVSCSLTAPVLLLPTFAIALFGIVAWQTLRRQARE